MIVLFWGVLISIDIVYFQRSVHLNCSHTIILLLNQFHGEQVIFDVNSNEAKYIRFIMDFVDVGVETFGFLGDILNPEQHFLFYFVWIAAYTFILLHDIDVSVDNLVENSHEIIDSFQV